jgi:hypothetical protein
MGSKGLLLVRVDVCEGLCFFFMKIDLLVSLKGARFLRLGLEMRGWNPNHQQRRMRRQKMQRSRQGHKWRGLALWVALGGLCSSAVAGQDAITSVSSEEFALYKDWINGRQDPRLEEFSDKIKMKKIAKNLGVKLRVLKAAVEKVEPVAASIGPTTERHIKASLESTPLKERIIKVHLDIEESHVVAWVQWRCGDKRDVEKEASYVGWAVGQKGHVVKTLALWCVNAKDTKLFSAKASRTSLARINKSGIERFATSRYIRLFEEVKRGPHR